MTQISTKTTLISVCLYRIADQLETNQYIPQAEEDSPYPEVRAAVANIDDPDMPANTFRVWVIGACQISMTVHKSLNCISGLIFTIVIAGLNQFFGFRYPSVGISSVSV